MDYARVQTLTHGRATGSDHPAHTKQETAITDDLTNRGAQDRARVALGEPHEVHYWTRELGVSQEQLQHAVSAVGHSAEKVRQHLAGQQQ
jgi:hypothetical protein